DLVREVRAEEEEHVALLLRNEDFVVPGPIDAVGEQLDELFAGLGEDVRDVLRAGRAGDRHHALARREAAADVKRLPRASLLPFSEAEGDPAGLAEAGLADRSGNRAAEVPQDEPERASDRRVRPA